MFPPPTEIGIAKSRQGIHERVEIGRNVQAEVFKVVTRINDECDLIRG